ncbi:DUF937 domain-containing protein [Chloroflexi bacterium TSY]|nr:DUF937 domain-containing protein [Chloroflexi bacterium TSY]
MSSILDLLDGELGQSAVQQVIGGQLGADSATTQKAIGAALPMLIGALGRNSATTEGAEALSSALSKKHNGSILDDLQGALGNADVLRDGSAILGHVLGGRQGNIESALERATGLDSGAAGQLLSMLAPIVLGQLGKTQRENGLDANGLAGLLGGEQTGADSALGGMAQLLDMDGDGNITDDMLNLGSKLIGGLFGSRN